MATLNVGSEGVGTGGVNGKVGVGTTNPAQKLEVYDGNVQVKDPNGNAGVMLDAASNCDPFVDFKVNGTLRQNIFFDGSAGMMKICEQNTPVYVGNSNNVVVMGGSVGIGGITSPTSRLHVGNGDIEVDAKYNGLVLKSPNGTRYRITVSDTGSLVISQA